MRPWRSLLALLLAAGASVLVACHQRRAAPAYESGPTPAPDTVVAKVDGYPITAARVATHGRALNLDARAALTDLIAIELLAQEATRRGLHLEPEVVETQRQEMVRRFIKQEFEASHGPDDIPEELLRAQLERNRTHFNHPEIRNVLTVLFAARRGVPPKAERQARRAAWALSRRWRLEQPATPKAARTIVDTYYGHLGGVRVDQFNTYLGAPAEKAWLKVALALKRPGAVSLPVQTRYGYHVIYLAEIHPARHTSEEKALASIREKMHAPWQRATFNKFTDALQERYAVKLFAENLKHVGGHADKAPQ